VGDPHVAGISTRSLHVVHESRQTSSRVVRHRSRHVLHDLVREVGRLFSMPDLRRTLFDRRSRAHVPWLDIKVSQTAETTRTRALTGLRYACPDHSTSEILGGR